MEKVALMNLFIGFCTLFLAASAGTFIAVDTTEAFLKDKALLSSWQLINLTSSHGHTNLFGLCHIALGLTMPWSKLSIFTKKLQTIGLLLGTFAMSILLTAQAFLPPTDGMSFLKVLIGLCLSSALLAIGIQCYGLYVKLIR